MATVALFSIFIILFLLHVPIGISLAVASVLILAFTTNFNIFMISQKMFTALNSEALMAIPGFVFAGAIMAHGGISRYLIDALRTWLGHLRGGLSVITVFACMIFAAISGSSPAIAAIGSILIPAMVKAGYDKRYAMGLVAASGTLGILIPPSITFVLFGVITEKSIGKLFMAGFLPGIFLGGALIVAAFIVAKIKNYGGERRATWSERWTATIKAVPGLLLPVIILGTIYLGIATPTEVSMVSVIYALLVSVLIYREMTWKKFREIMQESIGITAMIFLIIPAAFSFALYLTDQQIPQQVITYVAAKQIDVWVFWLFCFALLFIMGTFLEAASIVLITLPILAPIVYQLNIDIYHFAVFMVVCMELAMITPPVGLNLFVVCSIAKAKLEEAVRGVSPFILIMIAVLIILILFPRISLYLPSLMKY